MKAPPLSFLKWTCSKQIVIVRFAANNVPQFVAFSGRNLSATPGEDNNFSRHIKNFSNGGAGGGLRNYSLLPNKLSSVEEGILNKFNFNVVENLCILFRKFYSPKSKARPLIHCIGLHWLVHFWPNSTPICQQYLSKQKIFLNNI